MNQTDKGTAIPDKPWDDIPAMLETALLKRGNLFRKVLTLAAMGDPKLKDALKQIGSLPATDGRSYEEKLQALCCTAAVSKCPCGSGEPFMRCECHADAVLYLERVKNETVAALDSQIKAENEGATDMEPDEGVELTPEGAEALEEYKLAEEVERSVLQMCDNASKRRDGEALRKLLASMKNDERCARDMAKRSAMLDRDIFGVVARMFGPALNSSPCPCGSGRTFGECCKRPYLAACSVYGPALGQCSREAQAAREAQEKADANPEPGEAAEEGPLNMIARRICVKHKLAACVVVTQDEKGHSGIYMAEMGEKGPEPMDGYDGLLFLQSAATTLTMEVATNVVMRRMMQQAQAMGPGMRRGPRGSGRSH